MIVESGGIESPYDLLADVYDRIYSTDLNDRIDEAAILSGLITSYSPDAKTILDLGSGTGTVFKQLSEVVKLDEMVGVEQSSKMIERAHVNVPSAEFIQGDITDFAVEKRFDVVTCLFDTINHIRTAPGWEKVFCGAEQHLKPGGIFIFDMVTERLLRDIARSKSFTTSFSGGVCSFDMTSIGGAQYRSDFQITADDWPNEPTRASIVETSFPIVPVLRSLKKFLKPKVIFDHGAALRNDHSSWPKVTNATGRVMVLGFKASEAEDTI